LSKIIITNDEAPRGIKSIPLKEITNEACELSSCVETVLTLKRTGADVKMIEGRDKYLNELYKTEPKENFERDVLITATSKKQLTYYEVKYQMIYQVLEKPEEFFNDNILGKFYTKDFI
jgi:acyl-coenzyme A synthetase/AMP-(fatty) acid ligase